MHHSRSQKANKNRHFAPKAKIKMVKFRCFTSKSIFIDYKLLSYTLLTKLENYCLR